MEKRNIYEISSESFSTNIKFGIFRTYYNIISNQCKMNLFYLLFISIDALQIISLTLFNISYSSLSQNFVPIQNLLIIIKQIITLYKPNDLKLSILILYLTFVLFLIQILTIIYYTKNKLCNKRKNNFFVELYFKLLLILNTLYLTFFQIPLFVTFLSKFQCTTINNTSVMLNYPEFKCNSILYYINIAISSVNIILFLLISLINCNFFFDNRPISNLPWSGPKNKLPLYSLGLRFILVFFYTFEFSSIQYYFKNVIVLCATSYIGIYKIVIPLYHDRIVYHFDLYLKGMIIFISIVGLINKLIGTIYSNNLVIIILVSGLFVAFLFLNISFKVQEYYVYNSSPSMKKEKNALFKIILLIQEAKLFKTNKFKRNQFTGLLMKHSMKCIEDSCLCKKYLKVLNEKILKINDRKLFEEKTKKTRLMIDGEVTKNIKEIDHSLESIESNNEDNSMSVNECLYGTIKIFLQELIEKYPKLIDLNITFCYVLNYYLDNTFKCLYEIMKFSKKKLNLFNEFEVFYLFNKIEKNIYQNYKLNRTDDIDIESILEYNYLISKILDKMELTTEKTIEFWTEVKSEISRSKVYNSASNISNCIKEMKVYYNQLMDNLKFRNMNFLNLYSDFLEKIIFNEEDGLELKKKVTQYRYEIENTFHTEKETEISFLDMDEVGSVVISGKLDDLGKILSVNLKVCSLFKYDKNQLINSSINKIMPYYISIFHDTFLKRYLETAKPHIIDSDRIVFGLLSSGFIRPFHIHVKMIPNLEESIRFIGLLKKLKKSNSFFQTTDSTKNYPVSFIICSQEGSIFGITQKACINYGIPLNVLVNSKASSDNIKFLNINTLFPEKPLENEMVVKKLKSEHGCMMKLDTRSLKSNYLDFKETILDNKTNTFNFLLKHLGDKDKGENILFNEHNVLVFMQEISFNNDQLTAKIFKFVKIPEYNNQIKEFRIINDISKSSPRELLLKESHIRHTSINPIMTASNIARNKIYINSHLELNKNKKNLLNIHYPYQVKLFILVTLFTLACLLIIAVFELNFTLENEDNLLKYFKLWNSNNLRNIYFSSILVLFNNLLLIDNDIYSRNLYPNINTYRQLIIDKINLDINKTIEFNNNLTYYFSYFNDDLSFLYNNASIPTKNLLRNLTVYHEYESLSRLYNLIILRISYLVNDSLKFNNKMEVFYNSPYFLEKTASDLLREVYYIIENYIKVIRYYIENIGFLLDKLITVDSSYVINRERDLVLYFSFVICFIVFILFYLLVSKISIYKIKILTVFFLIDKQWADIIIKRCRKYLEESENFLKRDIKKIRSMYFFSENDEKSIVKYDDADNTKRYLLGKSGNDNEKNTFYNHSTQNHNENKTNSGHELKEEKVKSSFLKRKDNQIKQYSRRDTFICYNQNEFNAPNKEKYQPIENEEIEKQTPKSKQEKEKRDMDLLKTSISHLQKTRWIISLKILVLLVIVCIYFLITILINNKFNNDILQNSTYLKYIANRGWSYNNLLIFYKIMLMTGKKYSPYLNTELNDLYTKTNLDSIDLFRLYYNKNNENERIIQDINSNLSPILKGFIDIERTLQTSEFCSILNNFDPNFYLKYQGNCKTYNQSQSSFGLANSIGFINNFLYNRYNILKENNSTILLLNFQTMLDNLSFDNLAINIDNSVFLIDQAFIAESNNHYYSLYDLVTSTILSVIIRNSVFLVILLLELIFFVFLSKSLKNMIHEDKAILSIIPSQAMSKNDKIIKAIHDLKKIS